MAGTSDVRVGRSVQQRGSGDGNRRASGRATATRPLLAVCTVPASASDPLTLNPGSPGRSPRPPGFASPVVWKPAENKPGRQGSPRASGFLEDAAASPVKVAVIGTRRESHVFRRGSRSQGPWRSPMSGAGAARYPTARAPNSGAAGGRCPAQGRRGRELGSKRVYGRPAAHKGVAAAHRLCASAARRNRKLDLRTLRAPLSGALAGRGILQFP